MSFDRLANDDPVIDVMCVAESENGLDWNSPALCSIKDHRGSTKNNMLISMLIHSGFDECITSRRDIHTTDRRETLFGFRAGAMASGHHGTNTAWSREPLRRNGDGKIHARGGQLIQVRCYLKRTT